jgi:DNA invertase Pin-like site-specific DNA recombinase
MMFAPMATNIVTHVLKSVQSRNRGGRERGFFGLGSFWIGLTLPTQGGCRGLATSSIQLPSIIPIGPTDPLILIIGLSTIGVLMVSGSRDKSDSNNDDGGGIGISRGIIYTRVSSAAQAASGNSLENQAETLKEVAEDLDIEVVGPIVDDGETGKNWDRKGIEILKHMAATQEISHLLIDDVDRLGRSAIETLYFIWRLRSDYGITIITQSGRELDVSNITDLMTLSMKSIMADLETDNQSRRANSARRKQIEEKRNWLSWFKEVPLGYQLRSDDWIEPNPDEVEAVEALFSEFLAAELPGAYSPTAEFLNENYGELFEGEITSQKVKRLLKRPLYTGVPTPTLKDEEIPIEDKNLQLITEDTRKEVLEKTDEIYNQNSSDGHNADDLNDLVDRFGAFEVYKASAKLLQLCEECGSSSLNRSGTTSIENSSRRSQQYTCKGCGHTQALPTKDELEEMRKLRDKSKDDESDGE